MHDCILPFSHSAHTGSCIECCASDTFVEFVKLNINFAELLDLDPLSLSALNNKAFESLYNFNFLNSIQTQVFFCLYQTDQNALIGAPTGSGKTFCAELAMFRTFNLFPDKKCVYIAPLKALVRERFCDWSQKFRSLNIRTVELTGDHTPDIQSLKLAQVIITTPEKWDGITRSWELRQYVKDVVLVIVDEIHLLGVERGSVLEAIITRLKLMTAKQRHINNIRVIGLSTALANAGDVAEWLNVSNEGLFNFPPNVRPVPIEVHISGFPGQYYCPRMALMDRPAYRAIKSYSPFKPVLVFVASRRQTRLTAMAFMSQLATEEDPKQWLNMDAEELEQLISIIKDDNLKLVLPFGIGLHHAGLQQYEKNIIEQLYVEKKIQVLVTTATLAWGINMPAHLVIIKGTEYYDGKSHTYVDFPVTDILQMIGRAGRPQFDNIAIAVIFVHDIKKNFYKRFLYEPFPVESSLLSSLPNHINAEIYAGTITSKQDVVQYIANTYFYRRILANPGYYCVENATPRALTQFLVKVVDRCLEELQLSKCIDIYEEDDNLISTSLGIIASLYYLDHKTVRFFASNITSSITIDGLVKVLADCPEYDEIPVRHNEDQVNAQLQNILSCDLSAGSAMNSPHTKAFLMLMAHFTHLELGTDFASDQHSMLDQCIRIINAMMDMSLLQKWLSTSLSVVILMQMIIQGTWHLNHPLLIIPHFTEGLIHKIGHYDSTIPLLKNKLGLDQRFVEKAKKQAIREILRTKSINEREAAEAVDALLKWPVLQPRNCILSSATETFQIDYLQDEVNADYIKVKSSARYTVLFTFESIGPYESETDAFCPRFDKERKAGWIAIIGEKDTGEVLCCKRILPIVGSKKIILSFQMPRQLGRHIFTMFVMSDSYIGIDQEYNLYCDIVEKTWNY
ncbi:unnamed protein product [Thelazia callipaeda]|uniref:Activating signal cointegrator 1 complex subunit 3 n=1 Tax=Thelazia callipaeda TaxID=103827 RepID=A0A0N5D305_THECL|nr:unnamed protein product [Thelazia callipaeda]